MFLVLRLQSMVLITVIMVSKYSTVSCNFDTATKDNDNQYIHAMDNDVTVTNMETEIKANLNNAPRREHLRLRDDVRRNLTFDEEGNPLVTVELLEMEAQNSLLIEHDERFHHDFPGHKTIMPNLSLKSPKEDKDERAAPRHSARNCDLPRRKTAKRSSIHSKDLEVEEEPYSCPFFEVHASQVDPSLAGKVDSRDEDDLMEMIFEKPPKIVRHRRAFFNPGGKSHLWPNGEYVYVFDRNIDPIPKSLLLKAFKEIGEKVPCVKFIPADGNSERYIIHTSHNMAQCSSDTLGYMPDIQALVNVGAYCDYALVMHEVFHVLGAIHTHNRPDRDDFVAINWDNIDPAQAHNFKKKEGAIGPSENEYDYRSAMHYPANAFNFKGGNEPTLLALDKRIKLKDFGHYVLDEQDYESLKKWYGCDSSNSTPETTPTTTATEESDDGMTSYEERWDPDCIVGPWSDWSVCEDGYKTKQRYTEMPQNSDGGLSCPNKKKQIRCRPRRRHGRSTEPTPASHPDMVVVEDFEEDSGKAVTHMKKIVTVVEGQPIVLVVSNPKKFPLKWYLVIGGEDRELSSNEYNIYRTAAGNNRLTINGSSVEDNDGQLFVTKILMKNSILRVAWSIEVLGEDEYFSNTDIDTKNKRIFVANDFE